MSDPTEATIPPANTPAEINIHLGYLRRDILDMKASTEKSLTEIKGQINALDDHYVSEARFLPIEELAKINAKGLKDLTEWKDTFNGKMIGFGLAISVVSAVVSFALSYFLK